MLDKNNEAKWNKIQNRINSFWNKGVPMLCILAGIVLLLSTLNVVAPIWATLAWASCFIYNDICFTLTSLCIEMKYPCNLGTNEPNFRYHETWKSGCKVVLKDMIKAAPTKILSFFITICLLALMYFSLTIAQADSIPFFN